METIITKKISLTRVEVEQLILSHILDKNNINGYDKAEVKHKASGYDGEYYEGCDVTIETKELED